MQECGVDALVCVQPKNVYYLSSHQSDWIFDRAWAAAAVLPRLHRGDGALVVHDVELTALAERPATLPALRTYAATVCGEVVPHFSIAPDPVLDELERRTCALLEATLPSARATLIDATVQFITDVVGHASVLACDDPEFAVALGEHLPRATLIEGRTLLNRIRAVKTEPELALLREAARRNERALQAAFGAARPGVTWAEVHRTYMTSVTSQDCRPFCLYVGAGRRSMGLHADHDYALVAGDQLCFDAMLTYERYFGDAQRTCVLGPPSRALRHAWSAVSTAAEACYAELRPGADTGELRTRAVETTRAAGLPNFRHAFVHGLGLDHLEHPTELREFAPFTLEEGMVVNMDLEYCELGFGGIYFEDTVIVRADGPERLYSLPRELIELN
jgi:Xaa-Pro aminopeptidase